MKAVKPFMLLEMDNTFQLGVRSVGRGAQNLEAPQYPFFIKSAVNSNLYFQTAYCKLPTANSS